MDKSLHCPLSNLHLQTQVTCSLNSKNKVAGSLQKCLLWLNSLVSNKAQILIQVSPLHYGVYNGSLLHGLSAILVKNLLSSRRICYLRVLSFMCPFVLIFVSLNVFETANLSVKYIQSSLKLLRVTWVEQANR